MKAPATSRDLVELLGAAFWKRCSARMMERAKHVSKISHKGVKFKYSNFPKISFPHHEPASGTELKSSILCCAVVDIDVPECIWDMFRSVPDTHKGQSPSCCSTMEGYSERVAAVFGALEPSLASKTPRDAQSTAPE